MNISFQVKRAWMTSRVDEKETHTKTHFCEVSITGDKGKILKLEERKKEIHGQRIQNQNASRHLNVKVGS